MLIHMDQHPFIMNPQNIKRKKLQPVHQFRFKTIQDWKSVFTFRQRTEQIEHKRLQYQNQSHLLTNSQQLAASKGCSHKQYQYRTRDKLKQIHPPMKYTNKAIERSTQPVQKKRFSLRQIKSKRKEQSRGFSKVQTALTNARQNHISGTASSNRHYEDNQQIDFNFKHQKTENIQIEARKYQKEREIVQKKHHFKKLLDLSVTAQKDSQKRQIKDILRKCGYFKPRMINPNTETTQIDKFASIVQKCNK